MAISRSEKTALRYHSRSVGLVYIMCEFGFWSFSRRRTPVSVSGEIPFPDGHVVVPKPNSGLIQSASFRRCCEAPEDITAGPASAVLSVVRICLFVCGEQVLRGQAEVRSFSTKVRQTYRKPLAAVKCSSIINMDSSTGKCVRWKFHTLGMRPAPLSKWTKLTSCSKLLLSRNLAETKGSA